MSSGINPCLVNAVVILDAADEIRGKHLIAHAGCSVRWTLPISLDIGQGSCFMYSLQTYVDSGWKHSDHVRIEGLIGKPSFRFKARWVAS